MFADGRSAYTLIPSITLLPSSAIRATTRCWLPPPWPLNKKHTPQAVVAQRTQDIQVERNKRIGPHGEATRIDVCTVTPEVASFVRQSDVERWSDNRVKTARAQVALNLVTLA